VSSLVKEIRRQYSEEHETHAEVRLSCQVERLAIADQRKEDVNFACFIHQNHVCPKSYETVVSSEPVTLKWFVVFIFDVFMGSLAQLAPTKSLLQKDNNLHREKHVVRKMFYF
jgi:hypothetical protein